MSWVVGFRLVNNSDPMLFLVGQAHVFDAADVPHRKSTSRRHSYFAGPDCSDGRNYTLVARAPNKFRPRFRNPKPGTAVRFYVAAQRPFPKKLARPRHGAEATRVLGNDGLRIQMPYGA